jgi:hypothetical protein
MQKGIAWEDVERYNLFSRAQDMLPKGHAENLHNRNTIEELSMVQSVHVLNAMHHQFPSYASVTLQPSTNQLVVFGDNLHGMSSTGAGCHSLPAYVPFSRYVDSFLLAGAAGEPAELPSITYPISQREASIVDASQEAVVSNSTWISSQGSRTHLRSSEAIATVDTGAEKLQAVVHGKDGLHIVVEGVCTPATDSQCLGGHDADLTGLCSTSESQPLANRFSDAAFTSTQHEQAHGMGGSGKWTGKLSSYTAAGCMVSISQQGIFCFKPPGDPWWRAVLPDGSLVAGTADGKLEAWLSNGDKLELPAAVGSGTTQARGWLATTIGGLCTQAQACILKADTNLDVCRETEDTEKKLNGGDEAKQDNQRSDGSAEANQTRQQCNVQLRPLDNLESLERIDPDTGAKVTSREDLFTCVAYKTGDIVMLYGDGNRSIHSSDGSWIVECAHMPAVRGTREAVTCSLQHGVEITWMRASGALVLRQVMGIHLACLNERLACGAV